MRNPLVERYWSHLNVTFHTNMKAGREYSENLS